MQQGLHVYPTRSARSLFALSPRNIGAGFPKTFFLFLLSSFPAFSEERAISLLEFRTAVYSSKLFSFGRGISGSDEGGGDLPETFTSYVEAPLLQYIKLAGGKNSTISKKNPFSQRERSSLSQQRIDSDLNWKIFSTLFSLSRY